MLGISVCVSGEKLFSSVMRLGRMSGHGRKPAAPLSLASLSSFSTVLQLCFPTSLSQCFMSHLSIKSFQCIFICVVSALAQSVNLRHEC